MYICFRLSVIGALLCGLGVLCANEPVVLMGEQQERLNIEVERAMANGDLRAARYALSRLLELSGEDVKASRSYLELKFKLAEIEKELENVAEAENILMSLLQRELPNELRPSVVYLYAQILSEQGNPARAYSLFTSLSTSIPLTSWPESARTFYISLEYVLNKHYEEMIRSAERFVDAGGFSDAIPIYQEVLDAISKGSFPGVSNSPLRETIVDRIQLRYARACYEAGNYSLAVAVLVKQVPEKSRIYEKSLYLLTIVYNKMQAFNQAVDSGLRYLTLGDRQLLKEYDEVEWELGRAYYMTGEMDKAKKHFLSIPQTTTDRHFFYLARLHLARIYLNQKSYNAMEDVLKLLPEQAIKEDGLAYELAYLKAEAQFYQGHYEEATKLFEAAIPVRNKESAGWLPETLYNLAWSYLKQGEKKPGDVSQQKELFNKAEEYFNELLLFNNSERALLGLARLNLLRYYNLEDVVARDKAKEILVDSARFQSQDGLAEALLLRAEIATSYSEREEIYKQLADVQYKDTAASKLGWYFRGVNEFQEGHTLQKSGKTTEANELFVVAIESLTQAFDLLKSDDPSKAALSLKYAAQAYYYQNTEGAFFNAFELFDKLVVTYAQAFAVMPGQDEVLYLRGLVASHLVSPSQTKDYEQIAKASLQEVTKKFPDGNFADAALNLLGTIYFGQGDYAQGEEFFLKVAAEHPHSVYAGDAWFWASECADRLNKSPETVKFYRLQVFEKYPSSRFAGEAYFNYYTFSEYLQGEKGAMEHLKSMPEKYPKAVSLVIAYYLIGLDLKRDSGAGTTVANLEGAVRQFEKAAKLFEQKYVEGSVDVTNLEYYSTIRYRALLEEGLTYLSLAEKGREEYLVNALGVLQETVQEFAQDQPPYAALVCKGSAYLRISEEASFSLGQIYLRMKNDQMAKQVFSQMIEKYKATDTNGGYYLSRAWFELGMIYVRNQDYFDALKAFADSEQAAKGHVLSIEQKLELWIQQSLCYRSLGDYDAAMLLLSQIVNEDVVSNLRIRAMYLRAEIYELEGRKELAIKQLEAASSKGGEWALRAQERLSQSYSFN